MAAGGVSSGPSTISFPLDGNFATGVIQLDPSSQPAMLAALLNPDLPLPAGDVLFAGADLSIKPGNDIHVGPAQVGFSADANAALGVFSTPASLRAALLNNASLVTQIADALTFSGPTGGQFLMLRWGYDISATAAGSVALGPSASLSLNADASSKGYYAVVQSVRTGAPARASVDALIQTWKLPSQVRGLSDLPAGATIISEVDGSFDVGATVTFGYDFNWIRAVDGLGLKGDVGLKLKTGLSASIGYGLSGKYAIALSRDAAAPTIQMRLYKLRVNQWNFGFDGSLSAKPVAPPLPQNFDDLLRAVTGTHGQQIMKLLGQVEDWVDPNQPIFGPFVNLADSEAQKLIENLTGVTDLAAGFNQVKARIQKLFQIWDNLPQTATQFLWSRLPDAAALAKIAAIATQASTLSPSGLTNLIQNSLSNVAFLQTEQGKALVALAANGLFAALQPGPAQQQLQAAATLIGSLLDGSEIQALLTKLQAAVESKLDPKQIENVVDQTTFDSLDSWLKARLEDFLEQKLAGPKGVAEVQKLRAALKAILDKKDELYAKALAALQKTYEFDLNATYQSTNTTSALLDVTFDFGVPGSQAATGLQFALGGKFDELLTGKLAGVIINDGVLAFSWHTETHVSLTLPYFSTTSAHVNDAVAQMRTVNEDAGGLIFSLAATDLYTVKNDYSSALTVTMAMPARTAAVLVHSTDAATYSYELKTAASGATPADVVSRFQTYANEYFTSEFQPAGTGSFGAWVKQIAPTGGNFGNLLTSLKVSLPSSALLPWMSAPANKSDRAYKSMSIALQRQFKQVLHDSFFSDTRRYRDVSGDTAARAVLVFCAIPPCSDAAVTNSGDAVQFAGADAGGNHIYWDYRDPDLRENVFDSGDTVRNLQSLLAVARARIAASGDPDDVLGFYQDDAVSDILNATVQGRFIDFLFPVEANMVEEARNAGLNMAAFRQSQGTDPEEARKHLARFGQKLSEDFNSNLKTFAVGDALLPLGTAVYTAAANSLGAATSAPAAMFTITMLKDGVAFPPPGLEPASDTDVARTERVVHAG